MKKRMLGKMAAAALAVILLALPALALNAEYAPGPRSVPNCGCGGQPVERRTATGVEAYAGKHEPCPKDMYYNCPIYRVEYEVRTVCNLCGTQLADASFAYEEETRHLH